MNREPNTPEEILRNQNYIVLTTFKKNGQGVTSPIWFVFDRDKFFFTTNEKFWKVRRIRNNPNVEIAPAKARMFAPSDYKIIGKTIKCVARLLKGEEAKAASRLLRKNMVSNIRFLIFFKELSLEASYCFMKSFQKS